MSGWTLRVEARRQRKGHVYSGLVATLPWEALVERLTALMHSFLVVRQGH